MTQIREKERNGAILHVYWGALLRFLHPFSPLSEREKEESISPANFISLSLSLSLSLSSLSLFLSLS